MIRRGQMWYIFTNLIQKRHFVAHNPLHVFAGLLGLFLMCLKCICGRSSAPNTTVGAYGTPQTLSSRPPPKNLFPILSLRPRISRFPPRRISDYAYGFRLQSQRLQMYLLHRENVETRCHEHYWPLCDVSPLSLFH